MAEPRTERFPALDAVRVIATVAIFTFHFLGIAVFSFFPTEAIVRFGQANEWYVPALFFSADIGVQAFLYLSMFALARSALSKPGLALGPFLVARLRRILPPVWVAMAVLTAFAWLVHHQGPADPFKGPLTAVDYVANALGITIVRALKQMAGAWWFVGMILCAYLVFPLFLLLLRRGWPGALALVACGTGTTLLSQGPLRPHLEGWFNQYLVEFVGMRMMELTLGAALALVVLRDGRHLLARRVPPLLLLPLLALAALPVLRWHMTPYLAPEGPLRGFLLIVAACALCTWLPAPVLRGCARLSGPTYLVYLLHHPVIGPWSGWVRQLGIEGATGLAISWATLLVALFAVSLPLERLAGWIGARVFRS